MTRRPTCLRDGCARKVQSGSGDRYCSRLCWAVDIELQHLQRACEKSGPGKEAAAAWAALVTVSDAVTDYRRDRSRMLAVARGAAAAQT